MRSKTFNLAFFSVELRFPKRQTFAMLFFAALAAAAINLGSETYKMVTYYPAPYGSYSKFKTTGLTILAANSNAASRVLIGTSNSNNQFADNKLEVSGIMVLGKNTSAPDIVSGGGGLRWNGSEIQYNNGLKWLPLGGTSSPEMIAGGLHTRTQCLSAGGASVSLGTETAAPICKFSAAACPSGWAQFQNWSQTAATTFLHHFQCGGPLNDCSCGQNITTGSHSWSNTAAETVSYRPHAGCSVAYITSAATITAIGCY